MDDLGEWIAIGRAFLFSAGLLLAVMMCVKYPMLIGVVMLIRVLERAGMA